MRGFLLIFTLFYLLLGALVSPRLQAESLDIYLRQSSTTLSENTAIKVFFNDLRDEATDTDPGQNAVTFNRLELGLGYRNFELGYFWREDYALHYTSDTFELFYRDKNRLPIPQDKIFNVFLDVQHVKTEGLRFSYNYQVRPWLDLKITMNHMEASDLLYGQLAGQMSRTNGRIAGELSAAYYYEEDYLLKRRVEAPPNGRGYSLDWGAHWRWGPWQAIVKVMDQWGHIRWRDAPYTELAGSSSFVIVDDSGRARRRPIVSGLETYRPLRQPLPTHQQLTVSRSLTERWAVSYQREKYLAVEFNRWFVGYTPSQNLTFKTGYDFSTEAVWLAAESRYISMEFASDSRSFERARSLSLNIYAQWQL